jgi:hypothetical protein
MNDAVRNASPADTMRFQLGVGGFCIAPMTKQTNAKTSRMRLTMLRGDDPIGFLP